MFVTLALLWMNVPQRVGFAFCSSELEALANEVLTERSFEKHGDIQAGRIALMPMPMTNAAGCSFALAQVRMVSDRIRRPMDSRFGPTRKVHLSGTPTINVAIYSVTGMHSRRPTIGSGTLRGQPYSIQRVRRFRRWPQMD
jgi:hypothetical protein